METKTSEKIQDYLQFNFLATTKDFIVHDDVGVKIHCPFDDNIISTQKAQLLHGILSYTSKELRLIQYIPEKQIRPKVSEHGTSIIYSLNYNQIAALNEFDYKIVDKETSFYMKYANNFEEDILRNPDLKILSTQKKFDYSQKELESIRLLIFQILSSNEAKSTTKNQDVSELLVDKLNSVNKFYAIRNDDNQEIWMYDNGIYKPHGKSYIMEFCRIIMEKAYSSKIYNLVIEKIIVDNYINEQKFFNSNVLDYVPVQNGLLNIFTRKVSPFDPAMIFFSKLGIRYNPKADCPKIKKFIADLVEPKDVKVIQEIFGYLLLRDYRIERCFMLLGNGRNGKSKLAELMKKFIGEENITSLQPTTFENPDSFSTSSLFGKLANISIDINSMQLKNTSVLKSLTGRDTITAPRKFKNPIFFVNYAKLIFGANELPITRDTKDAFWERWILLEFPYTFINKKDYDSKDEADKGKYKIRDVDIIEKITTKEEMEGLLNYALDGLERLLKKKDFSYKYTPQEVMSLWIRKSDSLNAFILDLCELNYDSKVKKTDFFKRYTQYCKKNKLKVQSKKMVTTKLAEQGVIDGVSRFNNDYTEYYDGICFKDGQDLFVPSSLILEE
ncbi:phage/plasmid primase, P4 family [Lutibacter sp.]|uniref:DNA primase family protein n=1 Tax=Lutibacter sp. TaxID=1925666 RepID=UPI0034A051EC